MLLCLPLHLFPLNLFISVLLSSVTSEPCEVKMVFSLGHEISKELQAFSRQFLCWIEYNQEDKCWSEKLLHSLNEIVVNSLEISF